MKILLAIGGCTHSDAAVAEVGQRPLPSGSEVRIITVDPRVDAGLLRGGSLTAFDELVQRQRTESHQRLRAAVEALNQASPELKVTHVLREGRPKEAILDEAEHWGADLIVVGSHGYGSIRRVFLGSVSLAVATNASCSVEIVRIPQRPKAVTFPSVA